MVGMVENEAIGELSYYYFVPLFEASIAK